MSYYDRRYGNDLNGGDGLNKLRIDGGRSQLGQFWEESGVGKHVDKWHKECIFNE